MKREWMLWCVLSGGVMLWSCSEDSESARLAVRLTDAPAEYEAVNIDIEKVLVHQSETAGEESSGWIELEMAAGDHPINILELTNGVDTLLAEKEMPTGKISQIRLVLGSDNSLRMGGEEHALATPSSQQSGLKLKVNAELTPGITYEIKLDFDAAKSVVSTGAGKYSLKPVIRTIVEARSGAVAGLLVQEETPLAVYAISEGGETFGAIPNPEGQFLIQGLEPGTYTIEIRNASDQVTKKLEQILVVMGEVNDLGTIRVSE